MQIRGQVRHVGASQRREPAPVDVCPLTLSTHTNAQYWRCIVL